MNPPIGVLTADTLTPVPGTLASRLADADEERFVGRREELHFFDRLFDGDLDVAVVLVHGRAGIGKSTLLREVARRGARRGYTPRIVEGRDLAPCRASSSARSRACSTRSARSCSSTPTSA